jgi:hypothetical protein
VAPAGLRCPPSSRCSAKFKDEGLVVLAVNNGERFEPAHGFVEELGLDFTEFGLDPG